MTGLRIGGQALILPTGRPGELNVGRVVTLVMYHAGDWPEDGAWRGYTFFAIKGPCWGVEGDLEGCRASSPQVVERFPYGIMPQDRLLPIGDDPDAERLTTGQRIKRKVRKWLGQPA